MPDNTIKKPFDWPRSFRKWAGWLVASVALAFPVVAVPILLSSTNLPNLSIAWYASLAILFGELVGFSEITTRYRDEPLRAMFNRFGISYLLVNGFLSGCAFALMRVYGDKILPGVKDPFLTATIAGFGAMVVLRSKLFVFRTDDGKEIPIGPDLVITSILRIMDRKIYRLRAARRQQLVFELAKRIAAAAGNDPSFDNPNNFILISLASFQNLSTEEKQEITETTNQLQEKFKGRPTLFKAMVLGFVVLDIAGEDNLSAIMQDLEEYLLSPQT
ncbi:MAG: hypothetical protein ACRD3B_17035 [Candidatus Sulfotelmatobacter sp.]